MERCKGALGRGARGVLALAAVLAVAGGVRAEGAVPARDIRTNLFGACFLSPKQGWVAGDLGRIYRTADGGSTWERQTTGGRRPLTSISCVDANHVWVSTTHGNVFGSTDGGKTWTEQNKDSEVDQTLLQVRFADAKRGTAVGDYGSIIHTEDGGATWAQVELPEDFQLPESALEMGVMPFDAVLYTVLYAGRDRAWIAGEFGTVLRSDDGGQTWHQQKSGIESTIFGGTFLTPEHGFLVGIDGVILETNDGGENWTAVPTPFPDRSWYDIGFDGQNGWIGGSRGTLLQSRDGGRTWVEFPTPIRFASEWYRGVSLSAGGGMIVGGGGLIYAAQADRATLLGWNESAKGAPAAAH